MLTVLHLGKFYPPAPGGMERVLQLLCEGAVGSVNSRVLVASQSWRTKREVLNGVAVTRTASLGSIGTVGVCPGFPRELRREVRDLTVIHEPNPLALVSDWITSQRGPLVVWFHSEVIRPRWKYRLLYRPFLRRALLRADRIVVSSPNLAEYAAELQDFRHKCIVIPFGIDADRLQRTRPTDADVAEIAARFPGPRILFVGRLVPYKGLDVLIAAMKQVDATALIVGSGPLRGALEARAEASGVSDRVRFLGSLTDEEVTAHLHACDVFVLPSVSRAETFGMSQLEAMACGKPVISTNLPTGVPWVNQHCETGLVVPPRDPAALADALETLLSEPEMRAAMGAAARLRVEREFSVQQMVDTAGLLYQTIVHPNSPAPVVHAAYAASIESDTP
jgi:rhamnosyl/mannosyltransferase